MLFFASFGQSFAVAGVTATNRTIWLESMLTDSQAWAEACTLLSGSQLCYHKEWQKQIMIT